MTRITRREALLTAGAAAATLHAAATAPQIEQAIVDHNDDAVTKLMRAQITDAQSKWAGSVPDEYLMHSAGSAGGIRFEWA